MDIGAYELELPIPVVNVVDNGGSYTGSPFVATATVNGQSSLERVTPTLDYQLADGTLQHLGPNAPINVGTYLVIANYAGSTDYAAASDAIFFEIIPAVTTMSATDNGGTYNGTAFVATATVNGQTTTAGVTFDYQQYNFTAKAWQDLGPNALTYAGSYYVTASFAGSTDYSSAQSDYVQFTITPVVNVTDSGGTYNGTAFAAAATVNGLVRSTDVTLRWTTGS